MYCSGNYVSVLEGVECYSMYCSGNYVSVLEV